MTGSSTAVSVTDARRRVLHGWYMYDWANSAFAVTILAALFGPYLASVVVPEGGVDLPLLGLTGVKATSLYGYTLSASALLVMLIMPVLGAIADHTSAKRPFLFFFAWLGSGSSLLMFFVGPGDVWPALLLFFLGNFSFVSANVFYDAFLPHIASASERDTVSGKGYAYGYAGGGTLFVLQVLLVTFHEAIGIDMQLAIRISLGSVGLWWGGFSMITFARLEETRLREHAGPVLKLFAGGFRRIFLTMRTIRSLKHLGLFLLAFMVYNDGIQTVIAMATIYGKEELGFDTMTLMGSLLMIQFVGIAGAQMFGAAARKWGAKAMVMVSLVIWTAVVIYAFFMTEAIEFWVLGAVVGLVLGGSQALSRSLYSRIIPPSASAEFFGFFSVFEKFSAILGPALFAYLAYVSGSSRNSILSLVIFFVIGLILLAFVNIQRAEQDRDVLEAKLTSNE
jgi:MFS transporter, UMF1 family